MRNLHLDKRAHDLAVKVVDGDADELLSTSELAELFGVSCGWLEIGRGQGYGPPFIKLAPRVTRYRRRDLVDWLNSRRQTR